MCADKLLGAAGEQRWRVYMKKGHAANEISAEMLPQDRVGLMVFSTKGVLSGFGEQQ